MALTRTTSPPAPSPVDRASLERESPLKIQVPDPVANGNDSVETTAQSNVIADEPPTRVGRVGKQLSALSEDLKEIAELRVALAKAEITEQANFKVGQAKQVSATGIVGILFGFFALVTLALGLGWLLGHPFWGFLIVSGLLAMIALGVWLKLKPKPPSILR